MSSDPTHPGRSRPLSKPNAPRRQVGGQTRGRGVSDGEDTSQGVDWRLRVRAVAHDALARAGWALLSVVVALACGVLTGLRGLDGATIAPWVRSVVLLASVAALAAVACGASRTVVKIADERERLAEVLLRKDAVGPPRRWAIWIATLSTACVVSYLLNEHRPRVAATLGALLPARILDIVVFVIGIGLVAPYVYDLAEGRSTRTWPWSGSVESNRAIREDVDVIGAISRMSPPLLFAMFLALIMFVTTFVVGTYEPAKLLGGFGLLGFYVAGLFAAPALLLAQEESIGRVWRSRWYESQRRFVARLRVFIVITHGVIVVLQVASMGVVLGAFTSDSYLGPGRISTLTLVAIVVAMLGFVLSHALWLWRPDQPEKQPICADALGSYHHDLMRIAGLALVFGSVFSLVAVLIA